MEEQTNRQDTLFDKLKEYRDSDFYPYHMPGHKGSRIGEFPAEITGMDITEIDGFDDLHQPQGIILSIQKRVSMMYGAEESFLLVNGSTSGMLSAISAAVEPGGNLLMARNCHKSAYHAAYLRKLNLKFLSPKINDSGVTGAVTAEMVRDRLDKEEDIGAVLIVSPTYEGYIANVREIAKIVHGRGIPLIVDEAHGAHLGLAEGFAENSCQAGADIVIHSVHKTLPSLTQTALLHVSGCLIDREKLRRFLRIYQTSSPSYLFMASIDNLIWTMEKEGAQKLAWFRDRYLKMCAILQQCKFLEFPQGTFTEDEVWGGKDIGKLIISGKKCGISGQYIYDILRDRFHLQLEMAAPAYCLAMFTINDTEDAYERMMEACLTIDRELAGNFVCGDWIKYDSNEGKEKEADVIPFYEAWAMATEEVMLEDAPGRYAGEFINLYPPGIPYVIPGEKISAEDCRKTMEYISKGLKVQGVYKNAGTSDTIYVKVVRR